MNFRTLSHRHVMAALICASLSGCAAPNWVKSGATQAEFDADKADCEYDVVKYSGNYDSTYYYRTYYGRIYYDRTYQYQTAILQGIAMGQRKSEIALACMRSKGYRQATAEEQASVANAPLAPGATAAAPAPSEYAAPASSQYSRCGPGSSADSTPLDTADAGRLFANDMVRRYIADGRQAYRVKAGGATVVNNAVRGAHHVGYVPWNAVVVVFDQAGAFSRISPAGNESAQWVPSSDLCLDGASPDGLRVNR